MSEDKGIPVCISSCFVHSLFVYGSSEEVSSHRSMMSQLTLCVDIGSLYVYKVVMKSYVYLLVHLIWHRFKHQAFSKGQLEKLPSLGLGRGVRCGQKIHGRLVTSFTVQKSFVKCIRVSEFHLTTCSLMDALLTSSLPCASASNVLTSVPPTGQTPLSLSCASKTCSTP